MRMAARTVQLGDSGRSGARWLLVGGVVAGLCLVPMLVAGQAVDEWAETSLRAASGSAGVAVLVAFLLAADVVLPVPSSVVATLAGQRLGFVGGTVAVAAGLCAANAIGYVVGRAGSSVVARVVGPRGLSGARRLAGTRPGFAALALTRPLPMLSETVVILAGAARTPPARTAAVCGLANLGLAAVYAAIGNGAHGGASVLLAMAGSVGVPAGGLAVAAALAAASRRRTMGAGATT
jgi:uncharacterized membrane protein YdjX (TVP38/TMEM64 family)